MKSILKEVFIQHMIPSALLSVAALCAVLLAVSPDLNGSYSEFFLPGLRFYLGMFLFCMLVYGLGGALRVGLAIGMRLIRRNDFNDNKFRDQLQRFIVYVAETYIALLVLCVTGYIGITWQLE
ncbi:hypothetical protein FACS189488_11900 [Betaproteobacteria bacterium]|nr:hypothetical protein FACS189488_11900 [Betaproteobacteria bacterium]